ncbi:hypothetical protein M436DRAFT_59198, partial [Aureobasidium namibiae CBS 147.97]
MESIQEQSHPEHSERGPSRASEACARCRLKKARCSGNTPCTNCRLADAVCHHGHFKRSQRKMFPEHLVQALEIRQQKLEAAVHTMYYKLLAADAWPGPKLMEHGGKPLIHNILAVLDLSGLVNENWARHDYERPVSEKLEYGVPCDNESIVESPEQQYQERPKSLPTQLQRGSHS